MNCSRLKILLAALLASVVTPLAGQTITNASFEGVNGAGWTSTGVGTNGVGGAINTYGDWVPDIGITSAQDGSQVAYFLGSNSNASNAANSLFALTQQTSLQLELNSVYTLSAWFVNPQRGNTMYGGESLRLTAVNPGNPAQAFVIGMWHLEASNPAAGPTAWTERTVTVTVGSDTSTLNSLNGLNGSIVGTVGQDISGWDLHVMVGRSLTTTGYATGFQGQVYADNVSLNVIPEPATIALLFGLAAGVVVFIRRRRQ